VKYCDACHATYPSAFLTCPTDQAPLREATELVEGMILRGKYEILAKVGSGGMASVYKARHVAFGEIRAIKVVSSRLADDVDFLNRFRTEAVVTRRLQHPRAVRVDDLDTTEDGRPFIVMEYVEGTSLRAQLQEQGSLGLARALDIAGQVAEALGAAHRAGIVHRDIKPENILLTPGDDGREAVKVVDFGIAKVREGAIDVGPGYATTQTGVVVGTPQYLSPEQASGRKGDELDGRADLYALGLVLYEMLTGQLPFTGHTSLEILLHHVQTAPVPPHLVRPDLAIPPALSALLMRALAKDPQARFQTGEEMALALSSASASTPAARGDASLRDTLPRRSPGPSAGTAARALAADQAPTRTVMAPTVRKSRGSWQRVAGWGALALLVVAILGLWVVRSQRSSGAAVVGDAAIPDESGGGASPASGGALPRQAAEATAPAGVSRGPSEAATVPPVDVRPQAARPRFASTDEARVRELLRAARSAADREDYDAAVQALEQALALDPGNAPAQAGLKRVGAARLVLEGRRHLADGQAIPALRAFEAALALDPASIGARIGKRRAEMLERGRDRPRGEPRP
jgi:serine/threonine protein kinase